MAAHRLVCDARARRPPHVVLQFGTFVTCGSDGAYNFWDKDSKQRLKAMTR